MDTPEIGVEELLPQKWYHKNNLGCTDASEKTSEIQLKNHGKNWTLE